LSSLRASNTDCAALSHPSFQILRMRRVTEDFLALHVDLYEYSTQELEA